MEQGQTGTASKGGDLLMSLFFLSRQESLAMRGAPWHKLWNRV